MTSRTSVKPKELTYNSFEPPGISSYTTQFRWQPQSGGNQGVNLGSNQGTQIQFEHRWDKGFVNNYETQMYVDVDFEGILTDTPTADGDPIPDQQVDCLQIDTSIHSIFTWMMIKSKNKQIEFIQNIDIINAVLAIMNYSPNDRLQRSSEGFGGMLNPTGGNQFTRSCNPFVKGAQSNTGSSTTNYYNAYFQPAAQNGYYYVPGDVDAFGQQIVDSFLAEGYDDTGTLKGGVKGMVTRNLLSKSYVYGYQTKYMTNDFDTSRNVVQNPAFGGQVYAFPKVYGWEAPFVEAFSCTCFETTFSKSVYQNCIVNGIPNKYYRTSQTFTFPWMSAYFGILQPKQKFKMNPLKAWGLVQCTFQYSPTLVFSNNINQKRGYNIRRHEIYMNIIEYQDKRYEEDIERALSYGIIIPTCMWSYQGGESVSGGQYPEISKQIACTVTSLRLFVMLFMPRDYMKVPHVRKMKFLSQNMTSFYLTINSVNYPSQPIIGNGGTNFGIPNNMEFNSETLKGWHKLFKCDNNMSFYQTNSALNFCQWNPLLGTASFPVDPSTETQDPSNITDCTTNFNTSWDINYYFEQTGIPRCIYSIGFEGIRSSYRYQGGLNTYPNNEIDINRKFDAQNSMAYPNDSEVHYFVYFDAMVKLTNEETVMVGYSGGNA